MSSVIRTEPLLLRGVLKLFKVFVEALCACVDVKALLLSLALPLSTYWKADSSCVSLTDVLLSTSVVWLEVVKIPPILLNSWLKTP